jgi:membrane protein DedA with SNARE-associated domain
MMPPRAEGHHRPMSVQGVEQSQRLSNRTRLTLFLLPIALAFTGAQVAKALWPTLLTEAPWTLLVLSSNTTRMLLVEPLVPASIFFSLSIGRVLVLAPLYFFFGRGYGDAALRWAERKLGPTSRVIPQSEQLFRRFSHALVVWSPNLLVSVMAGATGMRARAFFPLALLGTLAKVTALFFLGDVLAAPLRDFADFVGRYQWYLTPITLAIVAVQLSRRRKRDAIPIETIDEFEHELEDAATETKRSRTRTSGTAERSRPGV